MISDAFNEVCYHQIDHEFHPSGVPHDQSNYGIQSFQTSLIIVEIVPKFTRKGSCIIAVSLLMQPPFGNGNRTAGWIKKKQYT